MTDVRAQSAITDILATLRRWYDATATPAATREAQTRTAYASKTPVPVHVLSVRREAIDRLTFWARFIQQERGLTGSLDTTALAGLLDFHDTHAGWLAAQPEAGQFVRELGRLARTVEEVARQTRPARIRLGICPEPDCDGQLVALVRQGDSLLPSRVRCDTEAGHVWDPREWEALGRRLAHHYASRAYLPVADAATVAGVPASTVRRWISEGRLAQYGPRRPYLVRVADVVALAVTRGQLGA